MQEQWTAVDDYITELLVQPDPILNETLEASEAAGLPAIAVSPAQGKLLMLLARMLGARRILEIGTLGGYSTIWLAQALPEDGRLITIESDRKHVETARANINRAGFAQVVDVHLGKALDVLPEIARKKIGPFDLTFIDADKPNIPHYFRWALELSHKGSIIIVDNVIREGAVIDAVTDDESVLGVRNLNEMIAAEPRVSATTIQTVGIKGYDGFTIALVV